MKYWLFLFILIPSVLMSQQTFTPEYDAQKLSVMMPNFKPECRLWEKPAYIQAPSKDTLPSNIMKVWVITSPDYNVPIYAFYGDTAMAAGNWKSQKNYIMNTEKLGPGKALFLFFDDGSLLKKNDVATLRKYKELPLL